jgi:hypothetical protein
MLVNSSAQLADLGFFRGRASSTATLGALDRFRVQGPIARLQPFLRWACTLVTAKGFPIPRKPVARHGIEFAPVPKFVVLQAADDRK